VTAPLPSVQFSQLAKDLHRMPRATRRRLKAEIDRLAQPLLADTRRRAGWSTRIPGAIAVRTEASAAKVRYGVQLRVDQDVAPHARPFEGMSNRGDEFRHPVFGDRDAAWVPQKTRPFAWPAVRAAGEKLRPQMVAAFEDAARECGFR
jgi:hypothetical protein